MSVICNTTEFILQTLQGIVLQGIAVVNQIINGVVRIITGLLKAAIFIIDFLIKTVINTAKWAVRAGSLAITNSLLNAFGSDATPQEFYNNVNDKWTSGREDMCNKIKNCRPLLLYLIPETVDCIPANMAFLKPWARYYYAFKVNNGFIEGSPNDVSDQEWSYFRINALAGDDFVKLFCTGSLGDLFAGLLALFFSTDVDEIENKLRMFKSAMLYQIERIRNLGRTLKLIIKEFYEKAPIIPVGYLAGCRNKKFTIRETLDYIADFSKCLCNTNECELLEKAAQGLGIVTRGGPNCVIDWNQVSFEWEQPVQNNLTNTETKFDEQLDNTGKLLTELFEFGLNNQLGSII